MQPTDQPMPSSPSAHSCSCPATMELIQRLLQATAKAAEPPAPFSGYETEDPKVFIENCETYFRESATPGGQRVRIADRYLEGDAAQLWAAYKNIAISWERFRECLCAKYANPTLLTDLTAKLYGEKQQEGEEVRTFLEQRHILARRLLPGLREAEIAHPLFGTLKSSLKRILRVATFQTVEELISLASGIEEDEDMMRAEGEWTTARHKRPLKSQQPPDQRNGSKRRAIEPPAGPPKCRFCPEYHWYRDCTKRPRIQQPGNSRRGREVATPPASV
jgi:hypothetical protein